MASPGYFRTFYDAPNRILKARTSASGMWSKAVLTYPCKDLAGDYVDPSGLDFTRHKADPSIDLEHGRHPDVRGLPVAWARESLSEPGAPYAVEYKSLNIAPDGSPPEIHSLPVGTSYFDASDRISSQVFALVEADALPAVSLEFLDVPGFSEPIGWSDLDNRPSRHFKKADVVRWTVCGQGVNGGALTLTKSLRTQVPHNLAIVLRDKRVNVGGKYEPLCGVILKSLAHYLPAIGPNRSTVRVEKAMEEFEDDETTGLETADEANIPLADDGVEGANDLETVDESEVDMGDGMDAPAANGVTALYAHADAITAACEQCKADLENSDNPKLIAEALKLCKLGDELAAKFKAAGDKHDAMIQAAKGATEPDGDEDGDEMMDDEDGDEVEVEEEEVDMEKDENGTFKAVRSVYKPILKALAAARYKRFSVADVTEPEPTAKPLTKGQKANEDAKIAKLETQIERLTKKLSYL